MLPKLKTKFFSTKEIFSVLEYRISFTGACSQNKNQLFSKQEQIFNFRSAKSIYLSIYLSVYLFIYLSICIHAYIYIYIYIYNYKSKFWPFCNNVIIECTLTLILSNYFDMVKADVSFCVLRLDQFQQIGNLLIYQWCD